MSLTDYNHRLQRCHSEKIKSPIWPNKKNQENPRSNFYAFPYNFRKKSTFPEKKSTFPEKIPFYPQKILTTFFLVIDSHFQILAPHFQISSQNCLIYYRIPFNSLLSPEKPEIHLFSRENPRKTQGLSKNPIKNPRASEKTQEPKIRSKNPRSWEKTQGVATLLLGRFKCVTSPPLSLLGLFFHPSIIIQAQHHFTLVILLISFLTVFLRLPFLTAEASSTCIG